ncbi:MAG: CoA transferase [Kibdelosporangium sp.]
MTLQLERTSADVGWAGDLTGGQVVDEVTAQAVCGLMHVHGRSQGKPTGLGVDYCRTATRVLTGAGMLAARISAMRGKFVTAVRTSVAQSALLTVSQYLAAAAGPEAAPTGPGGPPFRSADGVLFEVDMLDAGIWLDFWLPAGAPPDAIRAGWLPFQFRYATAAAPLPQALHDAASGLGFAELAGMAQRAGASICALVSLAERREDPVGPAWELRSLGVGDYQGSAAGPLPLSGFVVLEAGRRVQAPLAAHLLGLLGAEVVRIEPPGGDPLRGMPPMAGDTSARWLALNRDKAAVEIDIKDPAGRQDLKALVAYADVFLHNWAPGKAEHLGLGAADLAKVNPALVYAHTSGWANRLTDPPLGTDFMVQARTGLGAAVRPADEPPAPSLMTLLDVLGGLLGAHAILGGLLHRERTGESCRVESSLLAAADLLQQGVANRPRPGFRRPRPTADGWCAPADADVFEAAEHDLTDMSTSDALALLARKGLRAAPVTTDLALLPGDPRFADVIELDAHGCPAVRTPWRFE